MEEDAGRARRGGRGRRERRLYIREAADRLDRVPHTLRMWEYDDRLPAALRPQRDERGWRYWTEAQVEGLGRWAAGLTPGGGLPHYRPDDAKRAEHRRNMRGPRGPEAVEGA